MTPHPVSNSWTGKWCGDHNCRQMCHQKDNTSVNHVYSWELLVVFAKGTRGSSQEADGVFIKDVRIIFLKYKTTSVTINKRIAG